LVPKGCSQVNKATNYIKTARVRVWLVALPMTAWGLLRAFELPEAQALQCEGVAPTVAHAMLQAPAARPDVVLVDLDGEDGTESLTDLNAQGLHKILVLTSSASPAVHDSAILAGARGVLDKREDVTTLIKALHKVNDGEMWMDRNATSRIFMELARQQVAKRPDSGASRLNGLTGRERQTVDAIAAQPAAPAKVLAQVLNISENTLRNHLTSIYAKLDVSNRTDLYAFIQRHGLVKRG
jgi:two-component system, NarL family, nitrate/nitrite response regulator NarL